MQGACCCVSTEGREHAPGTRGGPRRGVDVDANERTGCCHTPACVCTCPRTDTCLHPPRSGALTWACGPGCPPGENREGAWLWLPGLLFLFLFHLEAGPVTRLPRLPAASPALLPASAEDEPTAHLAFVPGCPGVAPPPQPWQPWSFHCPTV